MFLVVELLNINKKVIIYILRYIYISLLVEMNILLKVIMKRVGYIDEKMIIKVYIYVIEKMDRELE